VPTPGIPTRWPFERRKVLNVLVSLRERAFIRPQSDREKMRHFGNLALRRLFKKIIEKIGSLQILEGSNMSQSQKSTHRGESMTFLMMLAPLALLFILFEMRLGGFRHAASQSREAGHFISAPAMSFDLDNDDPSDIDWNEED
jgi:hypothetical protein